MEITLAQAVSVMALVIALVALALSLIAHRRAARRLKDAAAKPDLSTRKAA